MRIARIVVVLSCLAQVVSACGCPEDRAPSGIEMTMPATLGDTSYSVEVCIDSNCEEFDGVQQDGAISSDGEVELELVGSDVIRYTSWRQIAPGTHDVEVNISDGTVAVAAFEGSVEFDQIDRCHAEDSDATIELVPSG